MNMKHLLNNYTSNNVEKAPFPHIIIKNALTENYCKELISDLPPYADFLTDKTPMISDNLRMNISASKGLFLTNNRWKELIELHTSSNFFYDLADLFLPHFPASQNALKSRIENRELKVGVRGIDNFEKCDVLLDAQIAINTPISQICKPVRQCHVDNPKKLFSGLYYLKLDEDESEGGNLELYHFTNSERKVFKKEEVVTSNYELSQTVNYDKNIGIFFLNSVNALHGVTQRGLANHPRVFLNFIAEFQKPLYDIKSLQYYD